MMITSKFTVDVLQQASKTRATSAEQKRLSKLPPRLAKQREQTLKEKKQKIGPPVICPTTQAEIPSLFAANVTLSGGGDSNNTFQIENWDNEMANNIPLVNNGEQQPSARQQPASSQAQQQTSKQFSLMRSLICTVD